MFFKGIILRLRLLSKARKEPYLLFHKVLGFYPYKIEYYKLAVRHSSVSIRTDDGTMLSNERLEFLGDAVLNSVVTDILYRRYENEREGFLTNTRSKIVKRESLNRLACEIGLDKLIIISKHVCSIGNTNIYGNALEALMGAIYLDYGYKQCKRFVENRLFKHFLDIEKLATDDGNFKSAIIEWSQKLHLEIEFVLVNEYDDLNQRHVFESNLRIAGQCICSGTGYSKKASQQNAAAKAMAMIRMNSNFKELLLQGKFVADEEDAF